MIRVSSKKGKSFHQNFAFSCISFAKYAKIITKSISRKNAKFSGNKESKSFAKILRKKMQNFAKKDKIFRIQDAYFCENFCTFLQNIFLLEILHMIHHSKALMPYM